MSRRWLSLIFCILTLQASISVAADRETLRQDFKKVLEKFHSRSIYIGQGNPKVTRHPMTAEQCLEKAKIAGVVFENPQFEKICGAPYMAPLFNPKTEKIETAKACIDQFEFPNIPCEYPVIWTRASEAVDICDAVGKRICDAHEWEGACAGALEEPDYAFDSFKNESPEAQLRSRRFAHNRVAYKDPSYAYGKERKKGNCAMNSVKSEGYNGGDWERCGSNTYPAGAFPECKSALEVFDLHGNAAEHMNIPSKREEMASIGSKTLGYTEMKGSWFIFDKYVAHPDHCRWRAPYWHGTKIKAVDSHANYHLSFRCCKDTAKP